MSAGYRAVNWNANKRRYDLTLAAGVLTVIAIIAGAGAIVHPFATVETLLIRALGVTAFLLLHVILSIGPLCRLDRRFLPLLYNRRHLGVTMFVLASGHGVFALVQFHGFSDTFPLVSVLTTSTDYTGVARFPFQVLGLAALGILFVMAATSHDFWLRTLTAPVWKRLHMMVYLAYALLVAHVALGALQSETSPWLASAVAVGFVWVIGLHVLAAHRESRTDEERTDGSDGWVDVCHVDEIPDRRARIACIAGERVAVFRYGDRVSALSNVCQHQNGPLGEGKIVNGCVVCPWHGYEYLPETGASPPPFTERVPTFAVEVRERRVFVRARPNLPGTRVEPARIA